MEKRLEIELAWSCLNKAADDELIFVLLASDVAAPAAVQAWIDARIAAGKNKSTDQQIESARHWIDRVKKQQGE